jgi:hypothetical protein
VISPLRSIIRKLRTDRERNQGGLIAGNLDPSVDRSTADLTELICVGSKDESGHHELSRTPEWRKIRVFPYWRLLAGRVPLGCRCLGIGDRNQG